MSDHIGPSFDCSAARHPLALMLCADPQLSLTDFRFGQAYYALLQSLDSRNQAQLKEEDVRFIEDVQDNCGIPHEGVLSDQTWRGRECVKTAYDAKTAIWVGRLNGVAYQEATRSPERHIALQRALQQLGFLQTISVPGVYTQSTRAAITAWQTARGRSVTGLLGDADALALEREVAPAPSPPVATAPTPPANEASTEPPKRQAPAPSEEIDGTAFAIDRNGDFLTNYHVVKNCESIRLRWDGAGHSATVVASDERNDLAAVRTTASTSEPLRFREGAGIRPGDGVVVLGFPYSGLLSSNPQVTTGGVSALSGIGDDIRFLQLTAPVQPGNSGGPLLDLSGNVVGIVSSRINDIAVAEATGSLPQNINFAIKSAIIQAFLDAHQISYETAQSTTKMEAADVAQGAAKSTFLLVCLK